MKTIFTSFVLIVTICLILNTNAKAQFVTISDPNFRTWLIQQYPSCFNASQQMDTTCNNIVNETILDIPNELTADITNIDEIKHFDNLQRLIIVYNNIQFISRFPQSLKKILITGQPLMSIPPLPLQLDTLIITYTQLFTIDSAFPQTLKYLNLMYNSLTLYSIPQLPNQLEYLNLTSNPNLQSYIQTTAIFPPSLKTFVVDDCQLNQLPQLNEGLIRLFCSDNNITTLPLLPNTITELHCSSNQIDSITNIPSSILGLGLSYNQLTELPELPEGILSVAVNDNLLTTCPPVKSSQVYLDCSSNFITEITGNFNYLQHLNCSNNLLTSLPDFTSYNFLYCLYCNNNNISCFPPLPVQIESLVCLDVSNNPATCVQNYTGAMDQAFMAAYPLCVYGDTVDNPNNCSNAVGILGATFKDENNNCNFNDADIRLKNIKVNYYDPINDLFYFTYSHYGVFSSILPLANYIVSIDTSNSTYEVDCNYPGLDTLVQINALNTLASDVNFSLKCKNGIDVGVQSIVNSGITFPGQLHNIKINAGDLSQWNNLDCAANTGGIITLNINGPVSYAYSNLNSLVPNVNGSLLTFNISDFAFIDYTTAFDLMFLTDTTAQINDEVCIEVNVVSDTLESNYLNNSKTFCYLVVNSYDPNYKAVSPVNVPPGFEDWLTYTVYFQNLGNAPAFNVRILDTLDSNLNIETFEIINYSHFNTVSLQNRAVSFRFPNIMLPDSASNPEGSIGFIQYRIKPLPNLPVGTQIENTAHIYFDFNPAIVTNTTVNEYITTVTAITKNEGKELKIFPNPSNGVFYVGSNAKVKSLEVFDFVGNCILHKNETNNFDLSNFSNGIYFVRVNGNQYYKVIKN